MAVPAPRGGDVEARVSDPLIVVADADDDACRDLTAWLTDHQVTVVRCTDGASALLETGLRRPDVLMVAADLPVVDGAAVLEQVRRRTSVPVVLGVARPDDALTARALAAGASACIARPYTSHGVAQLLGLAGRGGFGRDHPLACGPLVIDPGRYEVHVHGTRIPQLPLREFRLLHLLMRNPGRVLSRERIGTELWGDGRGHSNTITVHVRRLRERLGDDPQDPRIIQTVRKVGYRLVPPPRGQDDGGT